MVHEWWWVVDPYTAHRLRPLEYNTRVGELESTTYYEYGGVWTTREYRLQSLR